MQPEIKLNKKCTKNKWQVENMLQWVKANDISHITYWAHVEHQQCHICSSHNTGWLKKRPEHLRALCSGLIEVNQQESTYVVGKRPQIW